RWLPAAVGPVRRTHGGWKPPLPSTRWLSGCRPLPNPLENPANRLDTHADFAGDAFQALAPLNPVNNAFLARHGRVLSPLPFFLGNRHLAGGGARRSHLPSVDRARIIQGQFPVDVVFLSFQPLADGIDDLVSSQAH